jgi:Ras-related protein Rab-28
MISKYTEDSFDKNYRKTVGVDFFQKRIELNDDINVSLQLWDVEGGALTGKMMDTYVHDANAIVFVYDVTNQDSFESIEFWVREVALVMSKPGGPDKDPPIKLIFGNKADMNHMSMIDNDLLTTFSK